MIRLNLFMIWFLHFLSLLSVICRYYRQNSSSRIIVVLVYTVSTLFYMEDQSIEKIADITGYPTGTVKSHLSRAKEKMATYLKQNGYDGKQ